ncbi:MAG TPA: hypothetical protein VD997_12025 [Phycisphaerales bacterium]|nr:hypothetical protein [Phycisphaerales bacterium]
MGLNFAIDALYSTGWTPENPARCKRGPDARSYPDEQGVRDAFAEHGCTLTLRHVQLFDCYRAEWRETAGDTLAGAVVGQTAEEAAVYALAQLRRQVLSGAAKA